MGRNIGELNEGLASLHDALQRESFAAAKVRFSVIGFSDTAFTYLEPADLRLLAGDAGVDGSGVDVVCVGV